MVCSLLGQQVAELAAGTDYQGPGGLNLPDLRNAWRQPCHSLSSQIPACTAAVAPDPSRPALRLSAYLTGVVPAAPGLSTASLARLTGWQMLGNDQYGDCVSPDMRVLTADLRWVPAGDLSVAAAAARLR